MWSSRRTVHMSRQQATQQATRDEQLRSKLQDVASQCLTFAVRVEPSPQDGACFSHSLHQWVAHVPAKDRCRVDNMSALCAPATHAGSCWGPRHWAMCFASFCIEHLHAIRSHFVGGFADEVYRRGLEHYRMNWCNFSHPGVLVDPTREDGPRWSVFDDMPMLASVFHKINVVVLRTVDDSRDVMVFAAPEPLKALHVFLGLHRVASGALHYDLLVPEGTSSRYM